MVLTLRGCQPLAKRGGMAVTLTMGEIKIIKMDNLNSIFANRIVIEQKVQSSFEHLRLQIAENRTEKIFSTLSDIASKTNKDLQNQVILIQSRFNLWSSEDISGLNPAKSEMNQILINLLNLIDKIESEVNETNSKDLGVLIETLISTQKNLSKIRFNIEKRIQIESSFLGKIWIALIPQLEGTMTTIIKILYEINQLLKLDEFQNKISKEYGQDVVALNNPRLINFITTQDINTIDNFQKTLSETISINQRPNLIGRNDACPCGSGKKYKNCHGK